MGSVDALLNKGFKLIKALLITFCRKISQNKDLDLKKLEATLVQFKPQWHHFMDRVWVAAELMSHEQYLHWFKKAFRGTKCSPSSEDYDSNEGSTNGENSASSSSTSSYHAIPAHVTHSTSTQLVRSTTSSTSLHQSHHSRG